jgi:aminoglycoside phosphotransferase (APT) family kinase protein
MTSSVAAFVSKRWRAPAGTFRLRIEPVQGGLESAVSRARIANADRRRPIPPALVIKQLPHGGEREAEICELLWERLRRPPMAQVFGRDRVAGRTWLYLEDVPAHSRWPWQDTTLAAAVCRELARLHEATTLPRGAFAWDYEAALARSAESTLDLAERARDASGRRYWDRCGDLRRLTAALPEIRARLLSRGTTVIHGDMHPGNVILRHGGAAPEVVLIDWGRARLGSPLEDVASWLQSLGCWEPEARRRHDTLMRAYLAASRGSRAFSAEMRTEYALAAASNGLAGAIRYHLTVLSDRDATDGARFDSGRALAAWRRVVRLASALLSTSPAR